MGGCAGPEEKVEVVTGTVSIHGKPAAIEGLGVCFLAPNGKVTSLPVGPDGGFRGEVPLGELVVSVTIPLAQKKFGREVGESDEQFRARMEEQRKDKLARKAGMSPRDVKAPKDVPAVKPPFNAKYLDPAKSGLIVTIEVGKENTVAINLD